MANADILHFAVRPEWLAARLEKPIDAALPIVDAHHHLYDRPSQRYLLQDMLADIDCGHNVRASVFVQARAMMRADGPAMLRPVGETEFVNGIAAMSASGIYGKSRVCAGIVGFADLSLGDSVRPVLEAHVRAAGGTAGMGGRFCGIRQPATWDPDKSLYNPVYSTRENMFGTAEFRSGAAVLAELGLSFDAWVLFHQIPDVTALARRFPDLPIVLDHCGGIALGGQYQGRTKEVFACWKAALQDLAECPNVMIKLSGLGMRLSAFGFDSRDHAPSSAQLARAWQPWVETCIDVFGPARCMYGSNFPVDKGSYGYGIGLNALKHLCAGASSSERNDIFWRSAARFYRLPESLIV